MSEPEQSTLADLLGEWAELEPDRCFRHDNEYGEWFSVLNGDQTDSPVCTRHGIEGPSGLESEGLALIQSAVQGAVEERVWQFTLAGEQGLNRDPSKPETYTAWVYTDVPTKRNVKFGSHGHESPAHALLSAYLKALKDHE